MKTLIQYIKARITCFRAWLLIQDMKREATRKEAGVITHEEAEALKLKAIREGRGA